MLDELFASVLVSIFKRKGYARSCNVYKGTKLLEHVIKIYNLVGGTEF